MARSTLHDPLCPDAATARVPWPVCPYCLLIARVVEREHAKPTHVAKHAPLCWCDTCITEAVGPR